MNNEDLIELVKELAKLFDKYRIKKLECKLKPMNPSKNGTITDIDMLHLKISDIHGIILDDSIYDVLEK